jgi:signal recognition particle receptor subunit alpha
MIEQFLIFTKGGIVLWAKTDDSLRGDPINNLIRQVLLQERQGENLFSDDRYCLKWVYANEYDLVFVAVYPKLFTVAYVDELLDGVKDQFCSEYKDKLKTSPIDTDYSKFDKEFDDLQDEAEKAAKNKKTQKPTEFWETKKGQQLIKEGKKEPSDKKPSTKNAPKPNKNDKKQYSEEGSDEDSESDRDEQTNTDASNAGAPNDDTDAPSATATDSKAEIARKKLEALKLRASGKGQKGNKKPETAAPVKKGKKMTTWDDKPVKGAALRELDHSKDSGIEAPRQPTFDPSVKVDVDNWGPDEESEESEEEPSEEEIVPGKKKPEGKKKASSGLMSFFKTFTNRQLSQEDLDPVLDKFRDHLISKNVASEIAEKLCESVASQLIGKQLGSFTRVSTTVKNAMEESLTRILTPKRRIDILREVQAAQQEKRPYSIVFVGVNGVGKSTSLSKVCSWLLSNNLKVAIAACDTFRSGAIEQLQVHATNLGVNLYSQDYGKEPTIVAAASIQQARKDGMDVVLIDTAGRMADNELLMKALGKLVGVNKPDLVLFVGEALVGNDSVDQMRKFNRALEEYSPDPRYVRSIDGIVLTKFDTVDDKVGAAISMVYATGQPIVFVGVGQTYTDLKTLNVRKIVQILIKGKI